MFSEQDLPYLLRKEVIASIREGKVYIHNRKVYPGRDEYVCASSITSIADAMRAMVTQGGGILRVSLVAMIFLAQKMAEGTVPFTEEYFIESVRLIKEARKTNTTSHRILDSITSRVTDEGGFDDPEHLLALVTENVETVEHSFDILYDTMSDTGAGLISDGDGIFTTCFAEHTFILSLLKAQRGGKRVHVYVPETRPYMQGARLTAPSLRELGIPVTLMSDAMAAHMIQKGAITRYMSALDTLCMDGSAANKVGTLNNAILCSYYHLPFHLFAISPDVTKETFRDMEIEYRDPEELLNFRGERITAEGVQGIYPAFDIIPPDLITALVTSKGVLRPEQVREHYLKELVQ